MNTKLSSKKWLAGAVMAAGATQADAGLVQIDLVGFGINTADGSNTIDGLTDITGDGIGDFDFGRDRDFVRASVTVSSTYKIIGINVNNDNNDSGFFSLLGSGSIATSVSNNLIASATAGPETFLGQLTNASEGAGQRALRLTDRNIVSEDVNMRVLLEANTAGFEIDLSLTRIVFDTENPNRIYDGGLSTVGPLQSVGTITRAGDGTVSYSGSQVQVTAVPEPSSLGLLALGAGGLLARRRRNAA